MEIPSKVEFAVQIKGPACIDTVKLKLKENGVKLEDIETIVSNKEARILITTIKPWIYLQEAIEASGKRAVLVGFSDQAAVAMLDKGDDKNIKGVVRFCSITSNSPGIVIDGVIDGLLPKQEYELSICEFGDVSQGCNSLGDIYKKSSYTTKSDSVRTINVYSLKHFYTKFNAKKSSKMCLAKSQNFISNFSYSLYQH